jgi:voltage-dependent calcium channel
MFIAVIRENFSIAEEDKRQEQVKAFVQSHEPPQLNVSWTERLNPWRYLHPSTPPPLAVDDITSKTGLQVKRRVVSEFMGASPDLLQVNLIIDIRLSQLTAYPASSAAYAIGYIC